MKTIVFLLIVVVFSFSSEVFPQLRKGDKDLYVVAGADIVPLVENNGAMDGGVKPFVGAGLSIKIDAVVITGGISYVLADEKLFTVNGAILFELPVKIGAVRRPILVGPNYKMFVSEWEIHSINMRIQYNITNSIAVYSEAGFVTYSLREDRKTSATGQVGLKIAINWK